MFNKWFPARWWSSFLWIFTTYLLFAGVLPNLLLLFINCAGYLPYSDRPGPGWQPPHFPSKEELSFFFSFTQMLLRPTALYALGFGLIGLLLGFCSLPRWAVRSIGAPIAFIASGVMMMAAGWMIAISSVGVFVAAGSGLCWGLFVLPALVVPRANPLPLWLRVALPSAIFASVGFWLVRPLLPHKPVPGINIRFARCNDSGTGPIVALTEAFDDGNTIRQAGLDRQSCHLESGGQGGTSGTLDQTIQLDTLFLKPTSQQVDVPVPYTDGTLTVIDGTTVRQFPSGTAKTGETLHIRESADGRGFSMQDDGYARMNNWFWYEWTPETGHGVPPMSAPEK